MRRSVMQIMASTEGNRLALAVIGWLLLLATESASPSRAWAQFAPGMRPPRRPPGNRAVAVPGAPAAAVDPDAAADAAQPENWPNRALPKAVVANPLQQLIRGLFQPKGAILPANPGQAANPRQDEEGQPARVNPSDRDFIDSRAPHDAKIEHQLKLAEGAVKKRDWKTAVTLLQQLLDLPEDSLHRLPNGHWQSVRVAASRLLGQAPEAVLDGYQQQNGGLARQLLNDALRDADLSAVIRVATRFFHTDAGYQAADYLVTLHQDRAEFGIATQWLQELSASRAAFVRTTAWRLKAAVIYRQAGQQKPAAELLKQIEDEEETVKIGGRTVEPQAWVAKLPPAAAPSAVEQADWLQVFGMSNRMGIQAGGVPFLMAKWHVPYSSNHFVRQRIDWMVQDLVDQERAVTMAAQPLAVNGIGLYRDLRGMRAVDLKTGQSLWESIEGVSAERIVSGMGGDGGADPSSAPQFANGVNDPFGGQQADYHPLISLMLRDAVYNTLSSDGRQVFLLEDQGILSRQQPGWNWGWDGDQADPYGFSWNTNRMSSYDLETGRPLWTVGGPESNETFQLAMSGVYFHGAPTPDGDELFAVGSKGDEIRLWCLDRRTGGFRWSQLIGYSDTKIEQDIGRRWMAALPSVSEGIVVCPTTVGWLVAVDRLRHTVLWAVRYTPPTQGMDYQMGNNFTPQRELGDQWSGSAPVIAGQHVLFTPPEGEVLICVDLVSGTPCWQIPRANRQYLAGVVDGRVFTVSAERMTAHSMADGNEVWSHEFGEGTKLSGRGTLTAEHLYLPLNSGELRVLNLTDGKTASQTFLPSGQPPLGNLLLHQGLLISLGPNGLTGFRQQSSLLAEIQQLKAQNPEDPSALLSEAEIHLLNREAKLALPLLRRISPEKLPTDQQARWHQNLITGLTAVIRQQLKDSESLLAELGAAAKTPEERLLHLDLSAERFLALGQHQAAFELYWKLTSESTAGTVTRTDDVKVHVQRLAWLSGRLKDVWSLADAEARRQIDERISGALTQAASRDDNDEARRRLTELIGFHPLVRPLVQQMIASRFPKGETAVAELELLRLVELGDRELGAWAHRKLGELMEQLKLPDDAALFYRRLETEFADARLPNGQTGAEFVQAVRESGRVPFESPGQPPAWDDRPMKVMQLMHQYYGQPNQEVTPDSTLPMFDALDMEFQPQEQRLSFDSRRGKGYRWLAPLRTSPTNHNNGYMNVEAIGHSLALIHHDVLHLLSPAQKQMLWNLPLEGLVEGGLPPLQANRPPNFPMWNVNQQSGQQSPLLQRVGYHGRLAAVQTGYLAVLGRRTVHVLDSRTGAELWRRSNVLPQTRVVGGPDVLWLIPPRMDQSAGYRVSDGTPVKVSRLPQLLGHAVDLVGNDFLLAEQGQGLKFLGLNRAKVVLRRHNPLTQTDVWKHEFATGSLLASLSSDELLVVQQSGEVDLVRVADGVKQPLAALTAKDLQSRSDCYALADDERIFLVVNAQNNTGYQHFAESLPSVRSHGAIYAWQRSTGERLWKHDVKNQHLVLERFRSSPVLLFCSREWKQKGNINFSQLALSVVHKQTGKKLHESSTPTMYSGFQSLAILPMEQSLELRSYNLRMKLVPIEAAPEKPAEKGSD